jgi:hypothetical protein
MFLIPEKSPGEEAEEESGEEPEEREFPVTARTSASTSEFAPSPNEDRFFNFAVASSMRCIKGAISACA